MAEQKIKYAYLLIDEDGDMLGTNNEGTARDCFDSGTFRVYDCTAGVEMNYPRDIPVNEAKDPEPEPEEDPDDDL